MVVQIQADQPDPLWRFFAQYLDLPLYVHANIFWIFNWGVKLIYWLSSVLLAGHLLRGLFLKFNRPWL